MTSAQPHRGAGATHASLPLCPSTLGRLSGAAMTCWRSGYQCVVLALAVFAGCASETTNYPITHRSLSYDASQVDSHYHHEREYILQRRQTLASDDAIEVEYKAECYEEHNCAWRTGKGWVPVRMDLDVDQTEKKT